MVFDDLLKKSQNSEAFTREELVDLLSFPARSYESFAIMAEARHISIPGAPIARKGMISELRMAQRPSPGLPCPGRPGWSVDRGT